MSQQKKLTWIKKVSPILYDIALAAFCVYIGIRARCWANLLFPFETGFLISTALLAYYILDFLMLHQISVSRSKAFTYIISTCTFIIMYLSLTLILSDLVRLVTGFFVHDDAVMETIFLVCGFVCLAVTVGAVLFGIHHAKTIVTVPYRTECRKLKQDCRIVLLTDLHIGFFVGKKHIRNVVDAVNKLKPDMVVISGDIINAGVTDECPDLAEVADELAGLKSRKGTFAVTGNHDPFSSEPEFLAFLKRSHIRLLDDEVYTDVQIQLVGRGTKIHPRKALAELTSGLSREKPIIVLDHDPMGIRDAQKQNVDCIMCGHTHKGQIFPLNLFVRFLYRKDETWGIARHGNTTSVVSAGAGYFSMPMRIGSDSEVVCVDFTVPER